MRQSDPAYDLGEIDLDRPEPAAPPAARPTRVSLPKAAQASSRTTFRAGPALAGSLSLVVPGLGQVVSGELVWALFFASTLGCCAALAWATLATLDRLIPTLGLLGVPVGALVAFLLLLPLSAVGLHLGAVLQAHALGDGSASSLPHPIVAGLASLAIPGWGQILVGHRARAALFLAAAWVSALCWLVVTPVAASLLDSLGRELPDALKDGWGPAAMIAAPAIVWVLAIYDAAAGAVLERARVA